MVTFWWGEEIWLKATRTNQAQHQSTQYLWESELDEIFQSELDEVFLVFTFAEKCDYLSLLKVDSWYWTNLYLNDFLFLFLSYLCLGEMRNMITQACLKLQPCSDSWHWIQLVFKPSQAGCKWGSALEGTSFVFRNTRSSLSDICICIKSSRSKAFEG